jgi:hypothetical protein
MIRKMILSVVGVLTLAVLVQAGSPWKPEPIKLALPDFIVTGVQAISLDKGTFEVTIKNQGNGAGAACSIYVLLYGAAAAKPVHMYWPQPAIPAGASVTVTIKAPIGLSQVDYGIRANGSGTVPESNYANNAVVGQFGGKP